MNTGGPIATLLATAVLLPLISFAIIVLFGPKMGPKGKFAGWVASAAIGLGFVLSLFALWFYWLDKHPLPAPHIAEEHVEHQEDADHAALPSSPLPQSLSAFRLAMLAESNASDEGAADGDGHHEPSVPPSYTGTWWSIYKSGELKLEIGYYIDALTIAMFCMVTLIATCVHVYAVGYMHDELHDFTDPEVTMEDGSNLTRPGRFYRFFQYLSLFSFSMLGLVIAGNLFMVFVFWELVGICSYFLIGFYRERKSASDAANKAFIVNRVGDFGMLIGLMAIWASLGTFAFGDRKDADGNVVEQGMFSQVRSEENRFELAVPEKMEQLALQNGDEEDQFHPGYWLLVVAGVGIFCGCVGKSAQFPLHVWLPDAMEGPTPVSALVHSATMVAAGVYLVGRCYPLFAPEVLLVIAVIGCFTLFMAATIALVATDIKRVLAYSTLSQLGYMMFALGIGGWVAGMLHLITHAFFKSLLFLCSGSVIHAVHSNEMTDMGGLLKKMPITAWTMLVGCLAIIGAGIPTVIGLAGYYSKDAIIAQGLNFQEQNVLWGAMTMVAAAGAALTAFYMFRLWFMTFLGEPRDKHRYEHAHESPREMTWPLLLLAFFAIFVATPGITDLLNPSNAPLVRMLEQARPAGTGESADGLLAKVVIPAEHASHAHDVHVAAGMIAFGTASLGVFIACVIYWWRKLEPDEIRQQFNPIYRFLRNKWWFDELYDVLFMKPTHFVARQISTFDRSVIDYLVDGAAKVCRMFANLWDIIIDRGVVDGSLDTVARRTWDAGLSLRRVQSGKLRVYVLSIVVGTILLFVVASLFWGMLA